MQNYVCSEQNCEGFGLVILLSERSASAGLFGFIGLAWHSPYFVLRRILPTIDSMSAGSVNLNIRWFAE
jgi:hypothetical protein